MKNLLLAIGLVATLASCSKSGGDPSPAGLSPEGSPWSLNYTTAVTTPSSGGAPTSQTKSYGTTDMTVQFTSDGKVVQLQGKSAVLSGTYTYAAGVVTTSYPGGGAGGTAYNETSSSLTSNSLVLVHTEQTINGEYVTTNIYTR